MGIVKLKMSKTKRRAVQKKQRSTKSKSRHSNDDDESTIHSLWRRLKCSVKPSNKTDEDQVRLVESQETADESIPTTIVTRSYASTASSVAESSMYKFAAATAAVAKEFYEENDNTQSNLYRPTPSPFAPPSQMVHPVACKRDIYMDNEIEFEKENSLNQYAFTSSSHQYGKTLPENKGALQPYSISGSMLCDNMEKGKIANGGTSAPQRTLFSPQRPKGLPPNTIMASMLFRTMEHGNEDTSNNLARKALGSSQQYNARASNSSSLTTNHLHSSMVRKDIHKSSTSMTNHHHASLLRGSHRSPLRQTNNLLRMVQSNSFEEFDSIPEEHDHRNHLFEA